MKKRCANCRRWLSLDFFGQHADRADGLRSRCKVCERDASRRQRGTELPIEPQRDLAASWL